MFIFAGTVAGAVYVAAAPLSVVRGVIDPHWPAEQDMVQVIPLLLASPLTVAASFTVELSWTVATAGNSDTEIWEGGGNVCVLEPPHPKVPIARKADDRICGSLRRFRDFIANLPFRLRMLRPN
jgi:hypothetical protein